MEILNGDKLRVDLYHGTSTLFLDSIIKNGLGGVNPVNEWNLVSLCIEVCELSEKHLKDTPLYLKSYISLKKMAEQSNAGSLNFQHGDTYLTPAQQTAINYAINKRYGSEMLTYTIDFLTELINRDIKYVIQELSKKYKQVFGLVKTNPSPILIKVKNVNISSLRNEHGNDPSDNLNFLNDAFVNFNDSFELMGQQTNFRLTTSVNTSALELHLINVQRLGFGNPQYNLYRIEIPE